MDEIPLVRVTRGIFLLSGEACPDREKLMKFGVMGFCGYCLTPEGVCLSFKFKLFLLQKMRTAKLVVPEKVARKAKGDLPPPILPLAAI